MRTWIFYSFPGKCICATPILLVVMLWRTEWKTWTATVTETSIWLDQMSPWLWALPLWLKKLRTQSSRIALQYHVLSSHRQYTHTLSYTHIFPANAVFVFSGFAYPCFQVRVSLMEKYGPIYYALKISVFYVASFHTQSTLECLTYCLNVVPTIREPRHDFVLTIKALCRYRLRRKGLF